MQHVIKTKNSYPTILFNFKAYKINGLGFKENRVFTCKSKNDIPKGWNVLN